MKTALTFEAQKREKTGKGAARQLRRDGRIPAILYGKGQDPLNFSVDENEFLTAYFKGGIQRKLIDIKLDGQSYHVLTRDVQAHPVTDRPEHLDFLKVDADSRVNVNVPVRVLNADKCKGVKMGGALNIVRHDLELVSAPDSIPAVVKVDVAELNIGDSIHISQIELPAGVSSYITDRDFTILTVTGRGKLQEETAEGEEGEEAAAEGGSEGAEEAASEGGAEEGASE